MNPTFNIVSESIALYEFDFKGAFNTAKRRLSNYAGDASNIIKNRVRAGKLISANSNFKNDKMKLAKGHLGNIARGVGDLFGRSHFQQAKKYAYSDPAKSDAHFKKGVRNAVISGATLYAGHKLIKALRKPKPAPVKKRNDDDDDED